MTTRDAQSRALEDLRDQIVRLQQQYAIEMKGLQARSTGGLPAHVVDRTMTRIYAIGEFIEQLDPLLTLVRSVIEHGQETETEKEQR
jgi:hypothetical protein